MSQVLLEHTLPSGQTVRVVQGDITAETTEAIVNAANEQLQHGGGVAGAIRRRGGPSIQQESKAWVQKNGPVTTGSAAITGAGKLPAGYVIHAVGPVWGSGHDEEKLGSAVHSALSLAEAHGVESLAIPGISSGIFGGPKKKCAQIITQTTLDYLEQNPDTLQTVHFCNIDAETAQTFKQVAQELLELA